MDMTHDAALRCEACHAPLMPDDRFCEECGARAGADPEVTEPGEAGCELCGAPASALDADGYCSVCGMRRRQPGSRVEVDLVLAAAVSDQGRVHRRNEDAFHLELVDDAVVAVVCDGISSSTASNAASRAAADVAGGVLAAAVRDGADLADATAAAAEAAHEAVGQVPATSRADLGSPSCTFVCATCAEDRITVGWIGDSRAYWIAGGDARQLTVDHSWASEQVSAGVLSHDEAAREPRAHAITRWVGSDAPSGPPQIVVERPAEPGRLILCSDGLWNYAPSQELMARLLEALPAESSPVAVARALADTALARGGHDNITVAVVDSPPRRRPQA
jgi:PPM family protein phosphatase